MNKDINLWLDILDKTKELLQTPACEENARAGLSAMLQDVKNMERMLTPKRRFALAFSGLTNVGKSTLLNALLGDTVAPMKNCPWSSTAVEYRYSADYEMLVPLEGFKTLHKKFDTATELLNELKNFSVEGSAYQTDKPLVVKIPNTLLQGDITIVDTPGFGATDGTSEAGEHDQILLDYLKKHAQDMRIFWIVKDNINELSVNFYKEHLSVLGLCSNLIVNLTDDFDEEFIREFEKHYRGAIGHTLKIHYVDAKSALLGTQKKSEKMLKKSGILELKNYLQAFSTPEGRISIVAENLCTLFQNIADFLYQTNSYTCEWLPTAWGTLQMLLEDSQNQELQQKFNILQGE